MLIKCIKYYCLISISLFFNVSAAAQLGGLGGPLLNVSFGQAATGDASVPGQALPLGYTDFSYTTDICPPTGSYTVVSGLNHNCSDDPWIQLLADNSPFPDSNGYMMLINDIARTSPKLIFMDSIRETCTEVNYQFSVAAINVGNPSSGCVRFSSLTLQVEDYQGRVIASNNTGDIQFAIYSMGYHFSKYVVDFMVPAGVGGIVVKIIDNPKSTSTNCGNAFALDDIQVRVTGPKISIGFDSTPIGDWVKSTCFQDNKIFSMNGNIDPGFPNPAVQWQKSNDNGVTWADIPGATGYTYAQNFAVSDTFLFRLRGSDASLISYANCGVSSNLLKVQVDGIPSNFSVGNNSPLCSGQDLIFNVTGGASYAWWGPNGFTETAPYAHIYHSTLADSGMHYVKIISPGGCSVIDSTEVVMLGVDVKLSPDTSICNGTIVQLQATGGTAYEWSPVEGLSNPSIPNPKAIPGNTTTYTVSVKNTDGCSNAGSVTIRLRNIDPVRAKFTSPGFICRNYDSASFTDHSLGKIERWNWDFNNGQSSSLPNPQIQYYSISNNTSTYSIRLSVIDSAGCADTATNLLRVADNCYIAVPSAFSPNGDGLNDYLYPLNAYKARELVFRVFNRDGRLIFETRDWTKKWDGTCNGDPQLSGNFIWILQYTDEANKKIALRGSTILIR
ncbi:MAG: gliding motility-associated C-terminal domain-containing protein [Ferruginibacter sp.]